MGAFFLIGHHDLGSAGHTGVAVSQIAPSDVGNLYLLRLTYGIRPTERQLPSARELKTRAETDVVEMLAQQVSVYHIITNGR